MSGTDEKRSFKKLITFFKILYPIRQEAVTWKLYVDWISESWRDE